MTPCLCPSLEKVVIRGRDIICPPNQACPLPKGVPNGFGGWGVKKNTFA